MAAHLKPRRAPSFMMVRLIGPTGMDSSKPLIKPVRPATRMGGSSSIIGSAPHRPVRLRFLVFFLFNLSAHPTRDSWPDETVNEVQSEKGRQHVKKDLLL